MSYITEKKRGNPLTLSAAIALNGAIIIAVALSPMIAEQIVPRPPMDPVFVPIDRTPLPPKEKKTVKADPVTATDPVIKTIDPPPDFTFDDKPTDPGPFVADTGGGDIFGDLTKVIDPPKPIFKAATRDPRFANAFQPNYPPGLIQKEIEGSAKVKVLVGIDGRVRQVVILSASHPDFGKATERQALREWRSKPATRGGVPVEDWQTLTVTFHID